MARISRPPGFDMTYRPERRESFGPPMLARLPSYGALLAASLAALAAWWAPSTAPGSFLHTWVVAGDRTRLVPAIVIALVLCGTAMAAVLRTEMRGVIVGPEGIELRDLLPLGLPRVRRYAWSQIDKVHIPRFASDGRVDGRIAGSPTKVRLDLWDGSQTLVPDVARTRELSLILERVALARAIPIDGGTGLLDDLGSPFEGDENEAGSPA
jgi:hypothetical protein